MGVVEGLEGGGEPVQGPPWLFELSGCEIETESGLREAKGLREPRSLKGLALGVLRLKWVAPNAVVA